MYLVQRCSVLRQRNRLGAFVSHDQPQTHLMSMAWRLKQMRFGPLVLFLEQRGIHVLQFPRPSGHVQPHASHTSSVAWAPNQYQSVDLSVVAIEHHGLQFGPGMLIAVFHAALLALLGEFVWP